VKQVSQQQVKTDVDYGTFIQKQYEGRKLVSKGLNFIDRPERGHRAAYPCKDFGARSIGFHFADIPPHGGTGTHRHLCEAIVHIFSGRGYSIINGERYDWEKGDTIFIPALSWHKHINDTDEPARYYAAWSVPLFERLGLYMIEELGDEDTSGRGGFAEDLGMDTQLSTGLYPENPAKG
jgi:mannose-6-phosphate isomerase-like protein (cupin superfamily)